MCPRARCRARRKSPRHRRRGAQWPPATQLRAAGCAHTGPCFARSPRAASRAVPSPQIAGRTPCRARPPTAPPRSVDLRGVGALAAQRLARKAPPACAGPPRQHARHLRLNRCAPRSPPSAGGSGSPSSPSLSSPGSRGAAVTTRTASPFLPISAGGGGMPVSGPTTSKSSSSSPGSRGGPPRRDAAAAHSEGGGAAACCAARRRRWAEAACPAACPAACRRRRRHAAAILLILVALLSGSRRRLDVLHRLTVQFDQATPAARADCPGRQGREAVWQGRRRPIVVVFLLARQARCRHRVATPRLRSPAGAGSAGSAPACRAAAARPAAARRSPAGPCVVDLLVARVGVGVAPRPPRPPAGAAAMRLKRSWTFERLRMADAGPGWGVGGHG